jgi:hypothetical protein
MSSAQNLSRLSVLFNGKSFGEIMEEMTMIICYIDMDPEDFELVLKVDWSNYFDYKHQDIMSNMEKNELYEKMMLCED